MGELKNLLWDCGFTLVPLYNCYRALAMLKDSKNRQQSATIDKRHRIANQEAMLRFAVRLVNPSLPVYNEKWHFGKTHFSTRETRWWATACGQTYDE